MKILLANPRGFCAGVDRAIDIVERAIEQRVLGLGSPVVRVRVAQRRERQHRALEQLERDEAVLAAAVAPRELEEVEILVPDDVEPKVVECAGRDHARGAAVDVHDS